MRAAARTVVYRHECECPNASGPLPPDGDPVHRFDVDGEPFPWYITEDGVTFWAVAGGAYLCQLTILTDKFEHADGEYPRIDGREFPWLLWGPLVYTYDNSAGLPRVWLSFIADAVDTDAYIGPEVGLL